MPKGLTAVLNQPGKPLDLEMLPTPEVAAGGILIKNTAAAVRGGHEILTRSPRAPWRPENGCSVNRAFVPPMLYAPSS